MRLHQIVVLLASLVGISMSGSQPDAGVVRAPAAPNTVQTTGPEAFQPAAPSAVQPASADVVPPASAAAVGQSYFVDCRAGDDGTQGTAPGAAWRTLAPLQQRTFAPGDVVALARGCVWDGGLRIDASGTFEHPVTFTPYGEGAPPTIANTEGGMWAAAVDVAGDHVVVEGLMVRDAHEAGVRLRDGAEANVVRDVQATASGIGFQILGRGNVVTRNWAHDLTMVVDTPGGDDDYGAVGFWVGGPDNEVSYNVANNNRAASVDYGTDGGFAEIYGNGDRTWIHHNWAEGNAGFLEIGGRDRGSARDVRVAQNVGYDNGGVLCLHLDETFDIDVENLRLDNNTFVEPGGDTMLQCMDRAPGPGALIVRNNIFGTAAPVAATEDFAHAHNLFLTAATGFPLGAGERVGDALFVNAAGKDFRLQAGSPAVDGGMDVGLVADFDGRAVPQGGAPDIGAYERA